MAGKRVELVRRTVVLFVAIAAVAIRSPAAQGPITGTYRIAICKSEPCSIADTANVVVRGHIVLSDSAVTAAHFPEGRARQRQQPRERMYSRDGGANACYALQRLRLEPRTFAGIGEVALSRWSLVAASWSGGPLEPRTFEFGLYRSPDAGTKLIATVTNGVLRGRAQSAGAGAAAVDWPDDIAVGERVSDASLQPCHRRGIRPPRPTAESLRQPAHGGSDRRRLGCQVPGRPGRSALRAAPDDQILPGGVRLRRRGGHPGRGRAPRRRHRVPRFDGPRLPPTRRWCGSRSSEAWASRPRALRSWGSDGARRSPPTSPPASPSRWR